MNDITPCRHEWVASVPGANPICRLCSLVQPDEPNYEQHVMEITPIPDEPMHSLGSPCWCQPTIEDVLPNGRLVIHRRTLDSPRYESPPKDFGEQMLSEGALPRDLADAIAAKRAKS